MQICRRLSRRARLAPHTFARFPLRHADVFLRRGYSAPTTRSTAGPGSDIPRPLLRWPEKRLKPRPQDLRDPKAWISLLEPVLPRHLRSEGFQDDTVHQNADLTAEEVSDILAQARYHGPKLDILLSLADQGRWKAVVWLVTFLVDKLWTGNPQNRTYAVSGPWSGVGNLEEYLENPSDLPTSSATLTAKNTDLDQLLHDGHPLGVGFGRESTAGHEALGQIWQSLGNMIIKDSTQSTSIRLEILEILALLHNRGIMPETIYNYTPAQDRTALRQPPTLHLLSSHIFTSLSDAAWRAHEKRVVEEAQSKGSNLSVRPEIAGSVYRVRVGGLRHELWLELILWACLQGGWLPYGASVLEAVIAAPQPHEWSALSWRELINPTVKAGQERSINWDEVGYMVDTGGYADSPDTLQQQAKVARTVTSEVVTAYMDGLISLVELGVSRRGTASNIVVEYATKIKRFLYTRCNLGLEATSWDAIVQRIIESQTINIADSPGLASRILSLSSTYGEEVKTSNSPTRDEQWQPLSPYLIDGTAATLGVAHRIILAHVRRGDLKAALRSFEYLQHKVDRSKRIALVEFFSKLQATSEPQKGSKIDFMGTHPGLDYPTFFTQVPATTLAQLLDLVTDAGMEDFGRWLLYSEDPDGATIHKGDYSNPIVASALIRFATAFRDQDLLAAVLRAVQASAYYKDRFLAAPLLLALMDSQLQLNNYDQCDATLRSFALHPLMRRGHVHKLVALMTRALLTAEFSPRTDLSVEDKRFHLYRVKNLFSRVARGTAGAVPLLQPALHDMLVVAACINEEWAALCAPFMPRRLYARPSSKACTDMIRAVVTTMGAEAGKRMMQTLWSPAREEEASSSISNRTNDGVGPTRTEESSVIAQQSMNRTAIRITSSTASDSQQSLEKRAILFYRPTVGAMRAILVRAHDELLKHNKRTEKGAERLSSNDLKTEWSNDPTIRWCVRMMRLLGREVKKIDDEIIIKARPAFDVDEDLEDDEEATDADNDL
ncbi:hypothetical protein MBLNU457_6010t1 [Dothideomycetes sp. NU457]